MASLGLSCPWECSEFLNFENFQNFQIFIGKFNKSKKSCWILIHVWIFQWKGLAPGIPAQPGQAWACPAPGNVPDFQNFLNFLIFSIFPQFLFGNSETFRNSYSNFQGQGKPRPAQAGLGILGLGPRIPAQLGQAWVCPAPGIPAQLGQAWACPAPGNVLNFMIF